ncbi:chromate efflux transporter [Paenibacillus thiaminolyticus]|uniref:Chromate efflux transporter n=1 Tax=Paenibacillus thiaminolyticus TaxID=49283 RepID=A0AAP9DRP8_PANTH|nr:chromate efflux transporter [Paenibacillus thiaminolyticus]MCY9536068.1 chromate efflux transporter [Paenibacillus thiaminolyticus]MCY9602271.1 chromate efflux transporter [Paenibacillus thiaminolyticus]MCY9608666.1 chromate efflux transporter [Paenibacillus thiaminolyticus]MCY9613412.1 chromate efflux transporter [Paenibacillus thiaminolyticus]MCY9620231.1 chromate efflux transporter [Paenibacillus thiaminolyticus]
MSSHGRLWEVFWTALKLGLTSFGGPAAHIGYFRDTYVGRLRWVRDEQFADMNALSQLLPGPSSSQLGMAIGIRRAGWLGGIAAWAGFTLPSACLLILFAFGIGWLPGEVPGWLQGLKLVAIPVIIHALRGMSAQLTPDPLRKTIAAAAAIGALTIPGTYGQLAIIGLSAAAGWLLLGKPSQQQAEASGSGEVSALVLPRGFSMMMLILFGAGCILLPWLAAALPFPATKLADMMFRTGSLVFGGGHVMLPLLAEELSGSGIMDESALLAGYGAAQAVPGPLFTFSGFVGASLAPGWLGALYGIVALVFIFLPGYLLIAAALPFAERLRTWSGVRAALGGINAAVVGLLLAALYHPVWTTSVQGPAHFVIVLIGSLLLMAWKLPPWSVVLVSALCGAVLL